MAPGVQFPCFLALVAGPIPTYPLPKSSLGKPISSRYVILQCGHFAIFPLTTNTSRAHPRVGELFRYKLGTRPILRNPIFAPGP